MEDKIISSKPADPKGPWDTIIIGSGPSAFTAAIYTTRGAASTLILGGENWGGQLMLTSVVDNFPGFSKGILGQDLMNEMKAQAVRFGGEFISQNVESIDVSKNPFVVTAHGSEYTARSIIIATGAVTTWLDVPGIKEMIGRGVSSCAPCDAPFFKGKKVAVVGGGDSAMEEASILTKYASEVVIIHRRDTFSASAAMQEKVKDNPLIKIMWNTEVVAVNGKDKVDSLSIRNNKTNETSDFPVDGLFVAIGHKPASDIFKGKVNMDEKGYIAPDNWHCGTSVPGVFTAGDVMDKHFKQAIVASGMGCIAGMEALRYLENNK